MSSFQTRYSNACYVAVHSVAVVVVVVVVVVSGLGPQQSCPLTFNFVAMGLRTWYTYVLFRLLFVVVVVFFLFNALVQI